MIDDWNEVHVECCYISCFFFAKQFINGIKSKVSKI